MAKNFSLDELVLLKAVFIIKCEKSKNKKSQRGKLMWIINH